MNRTEIATRLKNARLNSKMTPDAVCAAAQISTSALGMYESGKRIPRDEIKVKLARLYNVSVQDLFFPNLAHDS